MKIYHIEFAKIGLGISGGETCMVEIIRFLKGRGVHNVLLTTDNGKKVYESLGLKEDEHLKYIVIKSYWTEEKFHLFVSYCLRPFLFLKIKKSIIETIETDDILMCHSEFLPNIVACLALSRYFKKKFYWLHMSSPDLFKGFMGQFTNTFHFPTPRLIHYMLGQLLYIPTSRQGMIISITPYYKNLDKEKIPFILRRPSDKIYTIKKYGGVGVMPLNSHGEKDYDLVFMGRFHPQKGLFEIPQILSILKEKKYNISLLVIGGGDKDMEKKFFKQIKELKLENNVHYVGFIASDKKFEYLDKARLFILPSYYESFGLVAVEAMTSRLPVVAYDLPVYSVFEHGMIKVPVLDNQRFADEIIALLNNPEELKRKSQEAYEYGSTFSWGKTGQEIYDLLGRF